MSLSEKTDFCLSENICLSKLSQISWQYWANNAFVIFILPLYNCIDPNMIFNPLS